MKKKKKYNRKNLRKDDSIWADRRCRHCEILITSDPSKIPEGVLHREWHIDCGDGYCTLCTKERAIKRSGRNPLDLENDDVSDISDMIEALAIRALGRE